MQRGAALAADEVDDHVDGPHEDDQVAERDHLLHGRQRDDVGELDHDVVGALDVPSARQLDGGEVAAGHHVRMHKCLGANGHPFVEHDRNDVQTQTDGDDTHPSQMQVRNCEPHEQGERQEHQPVRVVTVRARCESLTCDACHQQPGLEHAGPCISRSASWQCEAYGDTERDRRQRQDHITKVTTRHYRPGGCLTKRCCTT
jgi:hypothetical protein